MKKYKLGMLGVGNMGGSILEGIIKSSIYNKEEIFLYDVNSNVVEKYKKAGIAFSKDEKELVENVEILILAIKPQMLSCLENIKFKISNLVIVSIVAGKTVENLEEIFGKQKFIRVMPNTPALIKKGATAISRTSDIDDETFEIVKKMFSSIGIVEEIPDVLMNEVIPLNGSMPAFLYYFAKCFIDKAVKDGIEYDVAKNLACEAIKGSADMILESGKDIDTLIKDVCSPKGATLEGLKVFEEENEKEIIEKVADATIKRAYELSKI